MKRVAAGAHLPNSWLYEPAKRQTAKKAMLLALSDRKIAGAMIYRIHPFLLLTTSITIISGCITTQAYIVGLSHPKLLHSP